LKHVEQLRNIGIINSTTWSHLVGYLYKIYVSCIKNLPYRIIPFAIRKYN